MLVLSSVMYGLIGVIGVSRVSPVGLGSDWGQYPEPKFPVVSRRHVSVSRKIPKFVDVSHPSCVS